MLKIHWKFVVICAIVLVISFVRFHKGEVQQDNYLGYAAALSSGLKNVSFYDTRLFPGLPLIIFVLNLITGNYILSGYLAVFLAFIGLYIILYKLTGSTFSFILLLFPPVMFNQTTLIATEIPTVFFILLSLYFFNKKHYASALLFSGLGFWIRPIAIVPGFIILIFLFIKNSINTLKYLPFFFFPLILFTLFNSHYFGSADLFHQFIAYKLAGINTSGIVQTLIDIPRAFWWGWYRIFLSGLFYFLISLVILIWSILKLIREKSVFTKLVLTIIIGLFGFIYAFGPVPFLENLGRFLVPVFPLLWVLFSKNFKNSKILYLLFPLSILVVLV